MGELHNRKVDSDSVDIRPLSDLRDNGLLWLVNRIVFHPRGFALALDVGDGGAVVGWTMIGDGSGVWSFSHEVDDDQFAKAEAFLTSLRPVSDED
jgi:hypothetical protein